MKVRVWKSKRLNPTYLLVYYNEQTGVYKVTFLNGRDCVYGKSIINSYSTHPGGLWAACRYMGDDVATIKANINKEVAEEAERRTKEAQRLKDEAEAKAEKEREAENLRKSLLCSKDRIEIAPIDVLQCYDTLEAHLEQLKSGCYVVCINYKKKGFIELRPKAANSNHLKVMAKVEKDEKISKAKLHSFAKAVRKAYEDNIVIIGRTHALQSFGKKLVDATPHIKTGRNSYYSTAAPCRYYDKNTLVYLKLEQIEKKG